jgi:signal transduction histidine kinase
MMEFSHPGSKQKVSADLNRIIETTITVSRSEWKHVAEINTDLDPGLPTIFCLVDELGQVFLNLLINAAHAIANTLGNKPEGSKGRIAFSSRYNEQYIEIRIADTGVGIPDQIRGKVFDPFFTTKDVGKGTGQGLAIAHDVIAGKHGGTLTFETEPGSGTTFIIRLPRDNV